jgi:hypothetical protein
VSEPGSEVNDFRVSKALTLPIDFALEVLAVLAKRGAGKTYDAAVVAEEMLKARIPIVVVDGMGVWWGLRVAVKYEGDKQTPLTDTPGLPVVVFGGEHADLPLIPEKAGLIARSIVESGISAVIDISQLSKTKSRRIVGDFLYELYRINKNYGTRHVFVEESDQWAPQKAPGDVAYSLGAVDEIVRRGGNFNIGCTLITQRSAVLNKDVLTQADCLIVLRTLAPQDKKAIQAWVEEMTDQRSRELAKWYDSLKELRDGEAWVWHPDKPVIFKRVLFRRRETLHATREFLRSVEGRHVKVMPVEEYVEKFKSVFEPKPKVVTQPPKPIVAQKPYQGPERRDSPLTPDAKPRPIPQPEPISNGPVKEMMQVPETLPSLVTRPAQPNLQASSEEPVTALGKVCVVLKNNTDRAGNRLWTSRQIREAVEVHQWPTEGVDEAIAQLIRWEILTPVQKGSVLSYRFNTGRVQLLPQTQTLEVP